VKRQKKKPQSFIERRGGEEHMNTQALIVELQKEMPAEWARERRIEYLKETITDLVVEAWMAMTLHEDCVRHNRLIEMILTQERLEKLLKGIVKAQGEILSLRGSGRPGNDDITPAIIERARLYPFTQLYEFKRNMARCPFHEDRTPSMALMKDNRVHCFGACSKSWDTIAFLMDKDGLRFPEAVRQLQ
jgi:hypothetical protein